MFSKQAGAAALANALAAGEGATCSSVDLSDCHVTPLRAAPLCAQLARIAPLTSLSLRGNKLGEQVIDHPHIDLLVAHIIIPDEIIRSLRTPMMTSVSCPWRPARVVDPRDRSDSVCIAWEDPDDDVSRVPVSRASAGVGPCASPLGERQSVVGYLYTELANWSSRMLAQLTNGLFERVRSALSDSHSDLRTSCI